MTTESEFSAKFLSDPAFREELKKDPKTKMREAGIDVPDDVEIEVVESTEAKHYVALPPLHSGDELSESQLRRVQGGLQLYGDWDMGSSSSWYPQSPLRDLPRVKTKEGS